MSEDIQARIAAARKEAEQLKDAIAKKEIPSRRHNIG